MTAFNNRTIVKVDAATQGGKGFFLRERFAEGEEWLTKNVTNFARITVLPGCEMAYHQHVGDFEFYYFLEGEGQYNDNGTWIDVKPGDVYRCADGDWHSVRNNTDKDLVFIALIIVSEK